MHFIPLASGIVSSGFLDPGATKGREQGCRLLITYDSAKAPAGGFVLSISGIFLVVASKCVFLKMGDRVLRKLNPDTKKNWKNRKGATALKHVSPRTCFLNSYA
ncbi:conserved hypothetical protein [Coccidioides posadasii str. Silveira]|uniref:Uncharacterized protein n=1 Tax=Coccidioides posadasii (strain RMSCC 757 / Silveira) TaxID=443226 RepID=E9D4I7_COCPS|nr:conserved hypothetical protein [Coccidioides posadasii str. Silveira]